MGYGMDDEYWFDPERAGRENECEFCNGYGRFKGETCFLCNGSGIDTIDEDDKS